MRSLPDRRLPEPYRRWIDGAVALPPEVVLVPRTIDVAHDALVLAGLTLPMGAIGAFFLLMASHVRPETDGWVPLLATFSIGLALWSVPILLVRRLARTILASRERKRGALRQGIFVGPEGALVRMEPDRCHPIPAERFVSAKLIPAMRASSRNPLVAVETRDGTIEIFADRLDGHPGRIVQAARERWPADKQPPRRLKRKVAIDVTRTAGVVRSAKALGGSIVAFLVGLFALRIGGASWSNPEVKVTVVGLLLLIAAAALYMMFEYVRMRAFYRCPRCRARPERVPEALPAVHYFCAACNVEWESGLQESDID